jgi:hypothetical protein
LNKPIIAVASTQTGTRALQGWAISDLVLLEKSKHVMNHIRKIKTAFSEYKVT